MHSYLKRSWLCLSVAFCITSMVLAQTATQPASTTKPEAGVSAAPLGPNVGVIKGTNVYIRSGFNTNYYPVIKLNRGDRVTIAGEEFGWLMIEPPAGTFSLIEKNYVDKVSDRKGVVNGTAQVYAGSNMDERRYAKQVKLSKGAEVQILGETSDGDFYKIQPPPGSHVWVKGEFVERGPGAASIVREDGEGPRLETVPPGELNAAGSQKAALAREPKAAAPRRTPAELPAPKPAPDNDLLEKYQMEINAIETEIAAEGTKPLGQRQFDAIIRKLQPIADQTEDELSQLYARTRIEQLSGQIELAAAVRDVTQLRASAIATADEIARERERIRALGARTTDTIVVRGEIAASGIYDGAGNRPRRWRVVDPSSNPQNPRTIAYVEVPPGSTIDPSQYYGQRVGIKATSHQIVRDTIQAIPVYQVREIVLNPPPEERDDILSTRSQSASPVPVIVSTPASQPAGGHSSGTRPSQK